MATPAPITPEALDLDAYLRRIGYEGELSPTRGVFHALHRAHAYAIPFENLDVLLGRPIRIDLASVQAKLVGARRGGYCFEHNTLFAAVLRRLGFRLTTLAARVWLMRPDKTEPGPRTHMVLRVDLAEGPFLADVGFGGWGLGEPLRFVAGDVQEQVLGVYRLREEGPEWTLEARTGSWQDLYSFTLQEQLPIDYEVANHYTSTYPESLFRHHLMVSLPSQGGRQTLRDRRFVLYAAGGPQERDLGDEELLVVLRDRFGLYLPDGTRLACAGLNG
jgi:N-hydroxyarylamine O-acetyltransferase